MGTLLADIRQAVRLLLKNPAFTLVAVTALALGIGANTAIFSVINKVLLEPLPYPEPDRIVRLGRQFADGIGYSNSIPKYMLWRQSPLFSSMAIFDQQGPGMNLDSGGHPEQVKGVHVSLDYFKVFGFSPIVGRLFSQSEDLPNGPKAAIISESLWSSRFGRDPRITARTIVLNGDRFPVIGVMPRTFIPSPPADLWIALQADPNSTNQGHYLAVAGRLKNGVALPQVRAQMKLVGAAFRRLHPKNMDKLESIAVTPYRDAVVDDVKLALFVLLGAVCFVLLIACANVANLLLARSAARQRELAIRAAIGASRWHVIRQLLTESVLLSMVGGVAGFALGIWGVKVLLLLAPGRIPLLNDPSEAQTIVSIFDWRVAVFTLVVSVLTGLLFGLFPALQISRVDLSSTLKEASGRGSTGRRHNWFRKSLVAGEMALALVLLAGSMLLIRTFVGLSTVNTGIDSSHLLTLQTSLVGEKYAGTAATDNLIRQALRHVAAIPGVEAAAVSVAIPTETQIDLPFTISGKPLKSGEDYAGDVQWRSITWDYFKVLHVPRVRGRLFSESDTVSSAPVVIINRAMAKKYWPKENPVGQVIQIGKGLGPQFEEKPREVVGIVGDIRETSLSDKDVEVMYIPQSQVPDGLTKLANSVISPSWMIRSPLDSGSLQAAVQQAIQSVDAGIPVANVRSMQQVLDTQLSRQHFNMVLLSTFAGIALFLAAIGIYGLMSYSVEQQTQELGVRMALGASRPQVLGLLLRQGMLPVGIGVVAGLGLAFALMRIIGKLLFSVSVTDPVTFASVTLSLIAVALLSIYIPARRATRLDPVLALRQE